VRRKSHARPKVYRRRGGRLPRRPELRQGFLCECEMLASMSFMFVLANAASLTVTPSLFLLVCSRLGTALTLARPARSLAVTRRFLPCGTQKSRHDVLYTAAMPKSRACAVAGVYIGRADPSSFARITLESILESVVGVIEFLHMFIIYIRVQVWMQLFSLLSIGLFDFLP